MCIIIYLNQIIRLASKNLLQSVRICLSGCQGNVGRGSQVFLVLNLCVCELAAGSSQNSMPGGSYGKMFL